LAFQPIFARIIAMEPRQPDKSTIPAITHEIAEEIVRELQTLPLQDIPKIRKLIDDLKHRREESEASLSKDFMLASAPALWQVWDNDADDIYEKLYRK
jgi:hypothetical protein